jgi:CobQ-like glutamine amidotransferase family enzyme
MILNILHLYPNDMNIYGDEGNLLVLKRRAEWYGYEPHIIRYNQGDDFPKDIDIVLGGGGQDSGQEKIHADLMKIGPALKKLADNGVPMLMVCGLYQLFGHYFETSKNHRMGGLGILDVTTLGLSERLIGNIITDSADFGAIIGYENHSGQTFLGTTATPLATVRVGAGNNAKGETEGARYKNVIGTYLHGSLLPKNPLIADFLLRTAAIKKFGDFSNDVIDDSFAEKARLAAAKRPR